MKIVERFRELISGSDTKLVTTEHLLSTTEETQPPAPKLSESGLEQTIATYKAHFGERWKEAFFATAKIHVGVDK